MLLKVVIVDDEIKAINSLELILSEYCQNLKIVGRAGNVVEAIKEIQNKKPDIVFLDIEMPYGTGFDVLESIPERNFAVIFTTAYNDYAIKAIKANADDYLLKPVDIEELLIAVKKAQEKIQKPAFTDPVKESQVYSGQNHIPKKIPLATNEGCEFVNLDDIVRVAAEGSYSTIFLSDKRKVMVSKNLKEIEDMLQSSFFYRVHKSHLINLLLVKRLIRIDGGTIEMTDGSHVALSRRNKEEFIQRMAQFSSLSLSYLE
jgi:two-component system LytT family response regulator